MARRPSARGAAGPRTQGAGLEGTWAAVRLCGVNAGNWLASSDRLDDPGAPRYLEGPPGRGTAIRGALRLKHVGLCL